MSIDLTDPVSVRTRLVILSICALAVAALTMTERSLGPRVPLVPLFFLPLLVAAAFVPRWAIFLMAIALVLEREAFGPLALDQSAPTRLSLSLVAFTGAGLLAGELVRSSKFMRKVREEALARSDAEGEARAVVESSPAAVLTVDSDGRIRRTNEAARRMLGFATGSPEGEPVEKYIPLLAKLLRSKQTIRVMRTVVEASGHLRSGETFYAHIWVSLYEGTSGPRLAAIISDVTEQLRDREETGLRQLLSSSRIIAGAVSHEIRNLTAAASVLYQNLGNFPGIKDSADFGALGRVIESVLKLSSQDLQEDSEQALDGVDVAELLEELRTIISPTFDEAGASLAWEIGTALHHVRADHSGLLQVFINLAQNSCRALKGRPDGQLHISAYQPSDESVIIRFADNGPGISSAELLFQPLHSGASSTGFGLFISRAIVRTFGGELHHTQRPGECCFMIELATGMPQAQEGASA
jgi:two-component system, LuxR family, sensor kinase FixL